MLPTMTVRVGSQLPLDFHLKADLDGDGRFESPLMLTGVVELRLKRADGTPVTFATNDVSPRLFIMDSSQGHVQLRPLTTTWTTGARYFTGVFWLTDYLARKIPYPVSEEYVISVREA
jgi:hypothetical protein